MSTTPPPIVLSIAGHDPSGGAGIQADIEAIGALGCHPATAITCLTIQDSSNVAELIPVPPEQTRRQIEFILADYPISAIKIGLIGTPEMAEMLGKLLRQHPNLPIVLDPVLAAGGGTKLSGVRLLEQIKANLLPQTLLTTPNAAEARRLTGEAIQERCAEHLLETGCKAVLITGADEAHSEVINTLYRPEAAPSALKWPLLPESYHGSGCTLASAIAAFLAQGTDLDEAVSLAQQFTWESLSRGWRPGKGQYLPLRTHCNSPIYRKPRDK
ncbi:MAG: hydroxymethylpyrimidine/phosphomethylpyrimidine kinase [Sedimenticola sp.]